jgi:hypothetical protein
MAPGNFNSESNLQAQRYKTMTTDTSTLTLPNDAKATVQTTKAIDGRSPFGMCRKYRRALFATVRNGTASEQDFERFKSLGKDAYAWMGFRGQIENLKRKVMAVSKHVKLHKWQKQIAANDTVEV